MFTQTALWLLGALLLVGHAAAQCPRVRNLGRVSRLSCELTKSKEIAVRRAAARGLARLGASASAAVPALVEATSDDDATLRIVAVEALGRIGPAAAPGTAALVKVLRCARDAKLRVGAADSVLVIWWWWAAESRLFVLISNR